MRGPGKAFQWEVKADSRLAFCVIVDQPSTIFRSILPLLHNCIVSVSPKSANRRQMPRRCLALQLVPVDPSDSILHLGSPLKSGYNVGERYFIQFR